MNFGFLRHVVQLDDIPNDAEHLILSFERSWPAWVWMAIVMVAVLLAVRSYARLEGSFVLRSLLGGLRAVTLIVVAILLSGPMLEYQREIVERDWVLVLVDRSASMTVVDSPGGPDGTESRDDQLRGMLRDHAEYFRHMAEKREVRWFGFHEAAFPLGVREDADEFETDFPIDLGPPSGMATNIGPAMAQVLQRATGRPVSAMVIMSDGRTNQPPSRALIRQFQAEGIPVMVVPMGSSDPLGDLAIGSVQAPNRAFVRDRVPVVVEIDRMGLGAQGAQGTLQLVDELTGEVLAEESIPAEDVTTTVTLVAEPGLAGTATWRVVLIPDGPDLVEDNNVRSIELDLIDRPLRVLYVEGYPRWEYRYLKDILVREQSIESSVMLLSADRDFAQEGNLPLARLPRTQEEWSQFDVLILGDVAAGFFSPAQLDQMRTQVAEAGAGMLMIAGERSVPISFEGTPLSDLLPFSGSLRLPPVGRPVTMEPTPRAERLGVLRLLDARDGTQGWPSELSDEGVGWSRFFWMQRIDPARLKPTAEVLARTRQEFEEGEGLPMVLQMRYGAGTGMYVATDEIWRWRYGRGDFYVEQFWIQLLRTLGRESLTRSGDRAVLSVNPRRAEVRQPVRIELLVLDARLSDELGTSVPAIVEDEAGSRVGEIELRRDDEAGGRFSGTWLPDRAGSRRVRIDGMRGADLEQIVTLDVVAADEELRRPEADHDLLARLAAETGGAVLDPEDLSRMMLRDRSIRTPAPIRESVWDTWLAFCLVLGLVTLEWTGRRFLRLP